MHRRTLPQLVRSPTAPSLRCSATTWPRASSPRPTAMAARSSRRRGKRRTSYWQRRTRAESTCRHGPSLPCPRRVASRRPGPLRKQDACFIVRDADVQALAYVYFEEEPGRRSATKLAERRVRMAFPSSSHFGKLPPASLPGAGAGRRMKDVRDWDEVDLDLVVKDGQKENTRSTTRRRRRSTSGTRSRWRNEREPSATSTART
jgi:hypothetical protein